MAIRVREAKSIISPMNVLAIVVAIVLFGLVGHFIGKYDQNKVTEETATVAATQVFAYDGEDGKNALELLKAKADVQTQDSSLGSFVTSINGVENSEDHFWLFFVNDEMANSGADQFQTKNDDKIEWRYEIFQ